MAILSHLCHFLGVGQKVYMLLPDNIIIMIMIIMSIIIMIINNHNK